VISPLAGFKTTSARAARAIARQGLLRRKSMSLRGFFLLGELNN
jgi:hypothetical protein